MALTGIVKAMTASGQDIDRVSDEIAQGSEAQTLIVQKTALTVETNIKAMDRLSRHSAQTISKIRDATAKTQDGSRHAQKTLKHLEGVMQQIRETAAPISKLTAKVEKIRGIIGVVETIAQKTDLLALNASIEATRAGETGKGFALVAEEIRAMADSSKQSSTRISELIEEILQDNQNVARLLERNRNDLNSGTQIIHGIVGTFQEMLAGIEAIFQEVRTMERVTAEQLDQMTGLFEPFRELSQIAKQTAVSAQKTSSTIRNQKNEVGKIVTAVKGLLHLSDTMMEKQGQFKLPESM